MNPAAYQAALEGSAFYLNSQTGCLRISGRDTAAFVQRQTTNDAGLLKTGAGLLSVLTSPTARILDVFYLVAEPNEPGVEDSATWLALCLGGRTAETVRFLQKRVFFMDQVEIADQSEATNQLELFGPQAGNLLTGLGLKTPPGPNQIARLTLQGKALLVMNPHPQVGLGFRLAFPAAGQQVGSDADRSIVQAALLELGAVECDRSSYECLRIEAGIPAGGHELSEDFTPLETGLHGAVSGSKGCYTGQEIIARQLTYDKVTQTLCGLRLSAPLAERSPLAADGRPAGVITSIVHSPRFGDIGLGVVKRPFNEDGVILKAGEANAQVVGVPFGDL